MNDDETEVFRRLHDLAAAELDGSATLDEKAELKALLRDDPASRQLYVEYIQDTAGLRWSFAHTTIPINDVQLAVDHVTTEAFAGEFAGERPPSRVRLRWAAYLALAASALIGAGVYLRDAAPPPQSVAVLTRAIDAVWEEGELRELDRLHVGQALELKSGQVEMIFDTGVEVVLQGRTHFEIRSTDSAFSNRGTISARVGSDGKGFTIDTPNARVIDLGTEFGVAINEAGETEVAVFDGKVDLAVGAAPSDQAARQELVQGEAIRVGVDGQVDRVTAIASDRFPVSASLRPGVGPLLPIIRDVSDNIRVGDSNKFYRIVRSGLHEDSPAFVDRKHQWNSTDKQGLPLDLEGAEYVMPFNDDKFHDGLKVSVDVAQPATLYVFYSDSMKPPKWLQEEFVDTGFDVGLDESQSVYHKNFKLGVGPGENVDTIFSVWKREIRTPQVVELGAVESHRSGFGYNMYGIATAPLEPAKNAGRNLQ
ncbi:MAG: hypothetical protein C0485_09450 [Pirellula sp.]|nr:hypothetical protein [Pirellula sp.]